MAAPSAAPAARSGWMLFRRGGLQTLTYLALLLAAGALQAGDPGAAALASPGEPLLGVNLEVRAKAGPPQPTLPPPGGDPDERLRPADGVPRANPERDGGRLQEEKLIGFSNQPAWTEGHPFTETRIYAAPQGEIEFEYWAIAEFPRHGGPVEWETRYELELGLPARFQLSLYALTHEDGNPGALDFDEYKVEVRWALAEWGKIPGNPTLYLEWKNIDRAPDAVEGKILLAGEIASGWHWGTNLVFEHETGGAQENAYEITAGLSRTLVDEHLSLALEAKSEWADEKDDRGHYTHELLVGPSLQWTPKEEMHITLAPLFGLTDDSPDAKILLVASWEF